jgi:hypothetical protein
VTFDNTNRGALFSNDKREASARLAERVASATARSRSCARRLGPIAGGGYRAQPPIGNTGLGMWSSINSYGQL